MKYFFLFLIYSFSCFAWMKESPLITGRTLSGTWSSVSQKEKINIQNLLDIIESSASGKLLIEAAEEKAREQSGKLIDFIKAGAGSLTDTTLTRRFTINNPDDISFETKSIIYLNKELSIMNAVLDLSHELTHFVYRSAFNPYRSNFTLDEFIKSTIEGKGGEVQAFMMECQVLRELYPKNLHKRNNCYKIYDSEKRTFSQRKAVERFYQVGSFYRNFKQKLGEKGIDDRFEYMTDKEASFISSAYGVPYPVAAYSEYVNVISKVCENDKRRLALISVKKGRSPASESAFRKKLLSYQTRCSEVL